MPPSATSKRPLLGGDGGGEGAAFVAEEGGFEQLGGDSAGVDGDKRLVAARGVGVDGLGDQLFAGAAFALDEHGGAAGRDLRDEVEEPEHGFAFADDVLEGVALLEGALELDDLLLGLVVADGGADVGEQLFVVPGLLDEVCGAGADGVDHVADRAVGGDHDDRQIGDEALDARQEVDAAFAGQGEIEQQQVVGVAREQIEAGAAVGGHLDVEAFEVSRVSSESRMPASSSMMRMLLPRGAGACRLVRNRFADRGVRHALPFRVAAPRPAGLRSCGPLRWLLFQRRGSPGGSRAFADAAVDLDGCAVLLHDAVGDGEAEPGALVLAFFGVGLGGEEGIVDCAWFPAAMPAAVVFDAHLDAIPELPRDRCGSCPGRLSCRASLAFSMRLTRPAGACRGCRG